MSNINTQDQHAPSLMERVTGLVLNELVFAAAGLASTIALLQHHGHIKPITIGNTGDVGIVTIASTLFYSASTILTNENLVSPLIQTIIDIASRALFDGMLVNSIINVITPSMVNPFVGAGIICFDIMAGVLTTDVIKQNVDSILPDYYQKSEVAPKKDIAAIQIAKFFITIPLKSKLESTTAKILTDVLWGGISRTLFNVNVKNIAVEGFGNSFLWSDALPTVNSYVQSGIAEGGTAVLSEIWSYTSVLMLQSGQENELYLNATAVCNLDRMAYSSTQFFDLCYNDFDFGIIALA